ncbi:MAG TPA: PIN domain-containing protein [Bacteroidia bacterium]|nr:PIN domain-containing protein [Bacteroidia bacterium]
MKIFLDANVLVAVLNEEYPYYSDCARILSLTESSRFKVYTSPLCLAIAFYFAEKKNRNSARQRINILSGRLSISDVTEKTVKQTSKDKRIHDFEDGLQYYSALDSGCKVIITEDKDDFYFADIEVLNSRAFMENYVF